jgi:hypothetical protein
MVTNTVIAISNMDIYAEDYHPIERDREIFSMLAAEPERQAWVIHLQAILTASAPVIRFLADP